MRAIAHHAVAATLAEQHAQDETRKTRRDMHNVAASEVERTNGVADERAVATPHHMGQGGIHEQQPNRDEREHRAKLHAASQGARDNSDGDNGERSLESDVNEHGIRVVGKRQIAATQHVIEQPHAEDLVETAEERTAAVAAVGERPAGHNPQHANETNYGD